jgi:hypothetical protein
MLIEAAVDRINGERALTMALQPGKRQIGRKQAAKFAPGMAALQMQRYISKRSPGQLKCDLWGQTLSQWGLGIPANTAVELPQPPI